MDHGRRGEDMGVVFTDERGGRSLVAAPSVVSKRLWSQTHNTHHHLSRDDVNVVKIVQTQRALDCLTVQQTVAKTVLWRSV